MTSTPPCALIGVLDDGWTGLAAPARARLRAATLVIGAARTLALVAAHLAPTARTVALDGALAGVPAQVQAGRDGGERVVVLATGDPLCHGLGARLIAALGAAAVEVLPAPSTLQLAFARLRRPWTDARICSCHGGDRGDWHWGAGADHALVPVLRTVARHPLVAVFTSPANDPARVARALLELGLGDDLRLSVAARLAAPDEALFAALHPAEVAARAFPTPNLLICERARPLDPGPVFGLADEAFARQGGGPDDPGGLITKQAVRAVSLSRLGLRPTSRVWDIGAGSGAVGLEASRIACDGAVWAIEHDAARHADAIANARRLHAANYCLRLGRAPQDCADWPTPDAVFVGGAGRALPAIIAQAAARLAPGGRLVLNLIALERLTTAIDALTRAGLGWDLMQLGVAQARPIGALHRLAALNPVWIVTARRGPIDAD